jgi:hypothetical protein
MDTYVTLSELIQIGLFLVSYTTLLYAVFHNNHKKK